MFYITLLRCFVDALEIYEKMLSKRVNDTSDEFVDAMTSFNS